MIQMKPLSKKHVALGKKIYNARKDKHLTQEQLADKLGIARSYMGFLERGEKNPGFDLLTKIADVLGIPTKDLF